MSIKAIFNDLIITNNTDSIFELIQSVKKSIPISQRTGKGIIWSLRQIRKAIIQESIPLDIKKQSITVLINSEYWQVRNLTSFIITNCSIEENNLSPFISIMETVTKDPHFSVRESAQMSMRVLLQIFPDEILQLYDDKWITDIDANVRRCVSESLRPVLVDGKNWIRDQPQKVITRLKRLNCDNSIYVRKSVANNLSDISKRYPELVISTIRNWLTENKYHKWTLFIAHKSFRHIVKTYFDEVNELLKGKFIIK